MGRGLRPTQVIVSLMEAGLRHQTDKATGLVLHLTQVTGSLMDLVGNNPVQTRHDDKILLNPFFFFFFI
jgi:hypothetical protein